MDTAEHLATYLRSAREALLWKLEGLTEAQLREPRTPTGTNLLGLVKHCAFIQHGYFGECLGRDAGDVDLVVDYEADFNSDLYATAEESAEHIIAVYRRVGEYVDATLAEVPLDAPAHVPWWGPRAETTLGHLAVHVLYDLGRHAGHADILRESIDGAAGLRADNDNLGTPEDGWAGHVAKLRELAAGAGGAAAGV